MHRIFNVRVKIFSDECLAIRICTDDPAKRFIFRDAIIIGVTTGSNPIQNHRLKSSQSFAET
jgi:hypothetical protein